MNVPFFETNNDSLERQPIVKEGDTVTCPCGHDHILRGCTNEDGTHNSELLFYECGTRTYVAAIRNRSIMYMKTIVEGTIDVSCLSENKNERYTD
jgi:hypothetical protein